MYLIFKLVFIIILCVQIHPVCPEAYNVLALNDAENYEEALEYFKKAVELGTLVKDEADLQETLESKELFSIPPMRAYFRGLFGVGNTLRKMKRAKEALPYYEKLAELDESDGSSGGSYINYHAHLPELWLRAFGPEECLKRAVKYKNGGCIEYHSCQIPWYANLTLALFATDRVTSYEFPKAGSRRPVKSGFTREAVQGFAPLYLIRNHPFVGDLLTGKRPMPGGRIPTNTPGSESLIQAAVYATSCQDLWEKTPGAVEYLRKMMNTQRLGDKMAEVGEMAVPRFEVAPLLKLIDDGIFAKALHMGDVTHNPLLQMALFLGPDAHVVIDKLVAAGANVKVEANPGLTCLHKACYYGCGRAVVRSLVKAGLSPLQATPGDRERMAVLMAAEQGNWEELEECLDLLPNGIPTSLLQKVLDSISSSSCVECVGGGKKCGRCINGDKPHNPNVNYAKIVDIVAERGFRLYSLDGLEEFLKKVPRRGPYRDLIQYIVDKFKGLQPTDGVPGCCFSGCNNGSQEGGAVSLKLCVGCRSARYCYRECQVADWKMHKAACKAAKGGKTSKKK
jgi:tetratricopeptide (TPR) repeat protein